MNRQVVAVLMGGASSEHDISVQSGENVVGALRDTKYDVRPVMIGLDGLWTIDGGEPASLGAAAEYLSSIVDVVFIAMHGPYGEDGCVQGFLDLLGVPYTSSGICASSVAMDKVMCKNVVAELGVAVPHHELVNVDMWHANRKEVVDAVERDLGYPCVVKPVDQGSSVAMGIPYDQNELYDIMAATLDRFPAVMIEEFVDGTEVTGAVFGSVETGSVRALPVTEIVPIAGTFFDFESKYSERGADEIVPARIPDELTERVQDTSVMVHTALHCRTMSRSDMIIAADEVYFIEINTIPGLTRMSLYPKAAGADGIEFPDLIDMFIQDALAVHKTHKRTST